MKQLIRIMNIPDNSERERIKKHLNDYNFYVLSGPDDTLEVYVTQESRLEYAIDTIIVILILVGFYVFL